MAPRTVTQIDKDWTFRQADNPDSGFLKTCRFPTEVHLDLLHHGMIPFPFHGKKENEVQWVGEKSWLYKTTFSTPAVTLLEKAVLAFDGLDTYASVVLNGRHILKTDDMFVPERVDVTHILKPMDNNVLEITFESTYLLSKKLVEEHPDHHWGCWNGDPSRLAVRKAQYDYGWDWGPTLLTCGPWRPISFEIYESRISDLYFTTEVDRSLKSAEIVAKVDVEGEAEEVRFEVLFDGKIIGSETVKTKDGFAKAVFKTYNPKLWFPHRYGKQPLYALNATLLSSNHETLDTADRRFGLRRAQVIQRKLDNEPGTTFMFEINNIPIFCGGSNWIPAHSWITMLRPERYREWIKTAVNGNQVMLRVWGGGIFEQREFYDVCDEIGILVWQDFLFACGNYPASPNFLDLVKREAIANVKLLRHHPSIVIWAGNNEDYQYRETEGLQYDLDDKDPEHWLKTDFPARYIYEKILVDVTKEMIPGTYYHFGSPYGGETTADPTIGDIHQWNVWHGTQERYQEFDKLSGRFVSEFGMEVFPDMRTVDGFLLEGELDVDRYPQSSTVDFHNKAAGHERRLALYLAENIRYTFEPFEQYIYCTQLVQAEAVASAYRLWKRQWKGPGREYCAGALVWQMNDCWPAISWSIVDHYLRPKLAYFALKREMEQITIGMKRTVHTIPMDKYTRAFTKTIHKIEVWACNLTLEAHRVSLDFSKNTLATVAIDGGLESQVVVERNVCAELRQNSVELLPNRSTEIVIFKIPVSQHDVDEETQTVIGAHMKGDNGRQITRAISWPEPLKYIHLAKPKDLSLQLLGPSEAETYLPKPVWWKPPFRVSILTIESDLPLKGVKIEVSNDEESSVVIEDQGFDVMANELVMVRVLGLEPGEEDRLTVRYLGM